MRITPFLLLAITFILSFSFLRAQTPSSGMSLSSKSFSGPILRSDVTHPDGIPALTPPFLCGPDTILYTLAKTSAIEAYGSQAPTATGVAQWFEGPQTINIHEFRFFAWVDSAVSSTVTLTCNVYASGPDSLPSGVPLGTTTVTVDSNFFGGSLLLLAKDAVFSPAVTVSSDYVITVETSDPISVGIIANSAVAGDGFGEALSSVAVAGVWQKNLSVGLNNDWLILPLVSYSLDANYAPDPASPVCTGTLVNFVSDNPITESRFYNLFELAGTPDSSHTWDYGDGAPTLQGAVAGHAYSVAGTYNSTLSDTLNAWTAGLCTDVHTEAITVTAGTAPGASFSQAAAGLTTTFGDLSSGTPSTWFWEFGDGTTSTTASPTHAYPTGGTYLACLTVSNLCGMDSTCQTISVICPPTSSDYTFLASGLTVDFTDITLGGPATWLWDFGDGSTATSTNPSHTYLADGIYDVCLITNNGCGPDTSCQTVTVGCPVPMSAWSYTVLGNTVLFANGSVNSPTSYLWIFGDGGVSTTANTTHTYLTSGPYDVCLAVASICGTDTMCQTVNVGCITPIADFNNSSGSLTVNFTDISIGTATTWDWDFGDGGSATSKNPTYAYSAPGDYYVCLAISNPCDVDTVCDSISVNCIVPTVDFTFFTSGNVVDLTQTSTGFPDTWTWDFGDGTSGTTPDTSHSYFTTGTFDVCLTVENFCGDDMVCYPVVISCVPPSSDFSSVVTDSMVTVTDASTSNTTGWEWDFGDGTVVSGENPPAHTYGAPGPYEICLTVSNTCGDSMYCDSILIECDNPTSGFTVVQDGGEATFTDASIIADEWSWDFGDGGTSTDENPVYLYTTSGVYTVCLTVTNFCSSNTSCQELTVECDLPDPSFTSTQVGGDVSFTDGSTNLPTSWLWDFGDGNTDTLQNPNHGYFFLGTYYVCLRVWNSCGFSDVCDSVNVTNVGIEEDLHFGSINVFPNPNEGAFTVAVELTQLESLEASLVNVLGQSVYSHISPPTQGKLTLSVEDIELAKGVYFLRLKAGESRAVRKVIVE